MRKMYVASLDSAMNWQRRVQPTRRFEPTARTAIIDDHLLIRRKPPYRSVDKQPIHFIWTFKVNAPPLSDERNHWQTLRYSASTSGTKSSLASATLEYTGNPFTNFGG